MSRYPFLDSAAEVPLQHPSQPRADIVGRPGGQTEALQLRSQ
jgi:hypothetical protein